MASLAAVNMENVRSTTPAFVSQDIWVTSAITHVSKQQQQQQQQQQTNKKRQTNNMSI